MGWGCYAHEWDAGSDDWQKSLDELVERKLIEKPPTFGRDGEICPACYVELEAERDQLRRQRTEFDCRYTLGNVADISGSHCPLESRCQRCKLEDAELQIESARKDLSQLCDKIHEVTQDECSCGGMGPSDPCCAACRIYHRLNGTITK